MKSLIEKAKYIATGTLSAILPELASKLVYRYAKGEALNLDDPKTLDAKLQWLKLNTYRDNELITQCADKLEVRKYVEKCGLGHILNELIAVYYSVDDIDFDALPNRFAAKCNHGCGYNIICEDKSKLNKEAFIAQLDEWMREDYWKKRAEINYKHIKKAIIIEKFLESDKGGELEDYKIYCFNGEPMYMMLCENRASQERPNFYFVDRDWKLARLNKDSIAAPEGFTPHKPPCAEKLWEYAKILAAPFEFVRADFYVSNGEPVFGELTFTPCSAADANRLKETDLYFGSLLKLNK